MYELRVAAHTYFLVYGLLSCLTVDGSRGNSRHCRSGVRPSHVLGVNRLDETSGEICDATTKAKQVQLFRVSGNETNLPQISEYINSFKVSLDRNNFYCSFDCLN